MVRYSWRQISDTQLEVESRNLQNEIYENRSNKPLIFDCIYKLLKNKQERRNAIEGGKEK